MAAAGLSEPKRPWHADGCRRPGDDEVPAAGRLSCFFPTALMDRRRIRFPGSAGAAWSSIRPFSWGISRGPVVLVADPESGPAAEAPRRPGLASCPQHQSDESRAFRTCAKGCLAPSHSPPGVFIGIRHSPFAVGGSLGKVCKIKISSGLACYGLSFQTVRRQALQDRHGNVTSGIRFVSQRWRGPTLRRRVRGSPKAPGAFSGPGAGSPSCAARDASPFYYRTYVTQDVAAEASGLARPRVRSIDADRPRCQIRHPDTFQNPRRAKRASALEDLEEILPGLRCLIDASEQQVQRPKRKDMEKSHYSGKAGRHTAKVQTP